MASAKKTYAILLFTLPLFDRIFSRMCFTAHDICLKFDLSVRPDRCQNAVQIGRAEHFGFRNFFKFQAHVRVNALVGVRDDGPVRRQRFGQIKRSGEEGVVVM